MASSYKLLGQVAPTATTTTTLYTCPSATESVISTISICNRGSSATTYRLSARPSASSLANEHYIAYDSAIDANDTVLVTAGFALAADHIIEVYGGNGVLSFVAFGMEIT